MLVDDVLHALPDLRAHAESLMVDAADIVRPGEPVFDPATGRLISAETVLYADRSCWLRMPSALELEKLFGEEQVTATRYVACFAWDTVGVQISDIVRITTSADPDVLARTYRVVVVPTRSFTPLKNFGCESVE